MKSFTQVDIIYLTSRFSSFTLNAHHVHVKCDEEIFISFHMMAQEGMSRYFIPHPNGCMHVHLTIYLPQLLGPTLVHTPRLYMRIPQIIPQSQPRGTLNKTRLYGQHQKVNPVHIPLRYCFTIHHTNRVSASSKLHTCVIKQLIDTLCFLKAINYYFIHPQTIMHMITGIQAKANGYLLMSLIKVAFHMLCQCINTFLCQCIAHLFLLKRNVSSAT